MAYIPEDKIDEIKDQLDIVNIISEYVDLKQSGNNYIGLCPFHNEKTPSFTVSSQKGIFHCFGCGEGGDTISFIMKKENLSYPEAIQFLADKLGIFIETGKVDKELYEHRKKLYAINNEAKLFFFHNLLTNPIPKKYIVERGLKKELINKFMIGYATEKSQDLLNYMLKKGFKIEDLLELGLVKQSKRNNSLYDAYRNRLIFPIIDLRKNIIGFGGRTLVDDRAKYINSPESLVYHKSNNVYGVMNLRNVSKENKVILVEGYMDVISLSNYGIDYSVASLGTSLTIEQAKLISRYTKNVYICYDGDEAGINAAERALEIFRSINISPNIVKIPDGLDPDDYLKKYGRDSFNQLLENSLNPILYKYNNLINEYDLNDIDQKVIFLNKLTELLAEIESKLIRDEYINRFSDDLSLDRDNLQYEINKILNTKTIDVKTKKQVVKNQSDKGYKKILLESLRYIIFNPNISEDIIEVSKFLSEKTEFWTKTLDIVKKIDYNSEKSIKDQIYDFNIDDKTKLIFDAVFKVKDYNYYLNNDNAENYIKSMEKNKLIIEREILKSQFILLEDYDKLSDELKNVYNKLAMDIFKLDIDIKKMT
ncbi:DNA primase [Miniphocaeibacter halophilus]|uniref:DNA primase n=1 Tax=Miniphocaeibacter halophilus TaxID=2931922 RepID=A0AC61MPR8_9FIRM|nr:DNA primase [Miniphocaeibacter halophilus]QQK07566.1 DNA primase [Miniphocaeibacter halophilus]